MVLSCLRCMAAEEGSDTVMKRSCQPGLCVNRREGEMGRAVPAGGESLGQGMSSWREEKKEKREGRRDAAPLTLLCPGDDPCLWHPGPAL